MKFSETIYINKPRDVVVYYFADPNYMGEFQEGFVRKDTISGEPLAEGTISKLYYKQGKREMELTETVLSNQLPDTFEANYHHKSIENILRCTFNELDDNSTEYTWEIHYYRVSGFMVKVMITLFPGIFKKQARKWLENFKTFVEAQ